MSFDFENNDKKVSPQINSLVLQKRGIEQWRQLEKDLKSDFESMTSLKTFVDKEDIANMAIFLLSDEAKRISGQIMTVDGNTERMN